MAETRESSNQVLPCRLCLSDKFDSLKSIFCNELLPNKIPQKIQQLLLIQVQKEDKLSTLICNECIIRLDTWQSYKKQCRRNQTKLLESYNYKMKISNHTSRLETNLFLKSEPGDYESNNENDDVEILNDPILPAIKLEIAVENVTQDEDSNDLPPPLTPHAFDPNEYIVSKNKMPDLKVTEAEKTCSECKRIFCSIYSMKRHKKVIHRKKLPKGKRMGKRRSKNVFLNKSKIALYCTNESAGNLDLSGQNDSSQISLDDSQIADAQLDQDAGDQSVENLTPLEEKIQFAAGLKLVQKGTLGTVLSKVEVSYSEKCRAMVCMFNTHKCECHNVQYDSLRNLLSHLREVNSWFPLFTCYSCMISFPDRTSFSVHYSKCNRSSLETLIKLTNLKKRSENKIRLYQNYKCNLCGFIYSFYEDFCTHVEEEHVIGEAPFICSCEKQFETVNLYKMHCFNSCVLSHYCDICYVETSTIEEFLQHCQETHDNSEGFTLLQKSATSPKKGRQDRDALDTVNLVYGKRDRKKSVTTPVIGKTSVSIDSISTAYVRKLLNIIQRPRSALEWKKPARCPYCQKSYSTAQNMARHYKIHLAKNEVQVKPSLSVNQEEGFYSCPDCPGMFKASEWNVHLAEKHPWKSCADCSKSFKFQSELDEHRKTHLNVTLYRDSKTNSYTVTPLSDTSTSRNKKPVGEVMVLCEVCDIMFTNDEDLRKHEAICHIAYDSSSSSINPLQTTMGDTDLPVLEPAIEINEKMKNFIANSVSFAMPICKICNRQYSSKKSLREHMRSKHGKIKMNEYPKKCSYCEKVFTTGSSYYSHTEKHERLALIDFQRTEMSTTNTEESGEEEIDVEHNDSYQTCKSCFKVFDSKFKLKEHMKSHGGSKSPSKRARKVLCDLCHISVDDTNALIQHKIEEHNHGSNLEQNVQKSSDNIYTCEVCSRQYHSRRGYNRHKKTHGQTKGSFVYSKCKYCKTVFNSIDKLTKHMNDEHSEMMNSINTKGIKYKPKKSERLYKCSCCPKMFKTFDAMTAHSVWHKQDGFGEPGIQDDAPSTSQSTASAKLVNNTKASSKATAKKTSESNDKYKCNICSMQFMNSTALDIHKLQKHQNVDAKMLLPRCNTCNENFETQAAYDIHNRYHYLLEQQQDLPVIQDVRSLGEKKLHPCGSCNAKFNRSEDLSVHVRTSHDFKCGLCPRVFTKKCGLLSHLKMHEKRNKAEAEKMESTTIKGYACSICKESFNYANELREHTIKEHPF